MSFNRDNVVFERPDGTWARGFFDYFETGDLDNPDHDPEWDVEYDYSSFNWVSVGHASKEDAVRSWTGANPGGWTTVSLKDNAALCARYDRMAADRLAYEQTRPSQALAYWW